MAPDGRLRAVPIAAGPDGQTLDAGAPVPLFDPQLAAGGYLTATGALSRARYIATRDGRFLVTTAVQDNAAAAPITIVLNWDAELR